MSLWRSRGPLPFVANIVVFSAIYYFFGKFGLSLAFIQANATAIWPPSGIALVGLLLFGWQLWPAVFIGAFLVNVTTTATPIGASIGIAIGNTLEAVIGAFLARRFCGGAAAFEQVRSICKFMVLVAVLSTTVSASIGVTSLYRYHLIGTGKVFSVWLTWWLGDMMSIVMLASLLLIWSNRPLQFKRHLALEWIVLIVLVFLLSQVVFGGWLPMVAQSYPLEYVVIPCLLLAAFRHGQVGSALAACEMSMLAVRGTLNGFGPFASHPPNESLLLLQVFMGTTMVITLVVAAVIRAQRQAEDAMLRTHHELIGSTERLIEQSKDLEQFAYVASHDLREPLRKISAYVDLLALRSEGKLDQEASHCLKAISDSTMRLNRLIGDLLNYSRLGKEQEIAEPVLLDEVMKQVLSDLEPLIKESNAIVIHSGLQPIEVHPTHAYQLLQNLVTNAIKFRKPSVAPLVQISSRQNDGMVEVTVQDNGMGIDPKYHDQIFQIFRRLNSREKFAGTGIGLAICKRIVEFHGGRIWVTSEEGKGSSFVFTLPVSA
jgi:signal transduction histidine kinase